MPRRDRRFTAEDVARLYCRNLTLPQKALARAIFEECAPTTTPTQEQVAKILGLLARTLGDLGVPMVPQALEILALAVLSADEAAVKRIVDQMGLIGEPSA